MLTVKSAYFKFADKVDAVEIVHKLCEQKRQKTS